MNAEVKEKWIGALRSGKYPQDRNALQTGDGYCCLGVLCDLYINEHPENARWDPDLMFVDAETGYREDADLPDVVQEWSGIDACGSLPSEVSVMDEFEDELLVRSLVSLNDEANYNFAQIADVIEEKF